MTKQRITQYNPKNPSEFHSKITIRKIPHTLESLQSYGKLYKSANLTSINGRTKLGWINVIETVN